jgi:hypothetical protein
LVDNQKNVVAYNSTSNNSEISNTTKSVNTETQSLPNNSGVNKFKTILPLDKIPSVSVGTPANAQIIPSSPKDFFDMMTKPGEFFSKKNMYWFVGTNSAICAMDYMGVSSPFSNGFCKQNPDFRVISVSLSDASRDSRIPCYDSYSYYSRIGNEYGRKNNLKLIAYNRQNETFSFGKN